MKSINNEKITSSMALIALIAGVSILSGCGGGYREAQVSRPNLNNLNNTNTPIPTPTTTGTPAVTINPTVTYDFSITGQGGNFPLWPVAGQEPPALTTDATLKVRVTAGAAGPISLTTGSNTAYSNWTHAYDCVEYTISVMGVSRKTGILKVGSGGSMCPNAPTEKVLDLKGILYTGHPDITVKVTGASYSLYCQWLYSGLLNYNLWPYTNYTYQQAQSTYCSTSMFSVYKSHVVTGTIDIEVDGGGT